MYRINVKERFDVRFMIKALVFIQGLNMFQARVLAFLSFSMIIFYSAIEIGLYSLYRETMQNEAIVRSWYSFPREKKFIQLSRKQSRLIV